MTDERDDIDEWPPRRSAPSAVAPDDDTISVPERSVVDDPDLEERDGSSIGAPDAELVPGSTRAERRTAGRRTRRRTRRRTLAVALVIGGLVLVPLVAALGWFAWQLDPPGAPGAPVTLVVEPGWGAKQAGDALASSNVIGSAFAFQVWAKVNGTNFQAGTYQLREDLGVRGAASALEAGPRAVVTNQQRLLLPPGLTLSQIADRVGSLPGHTRDAFLQAAAAGTVRSKYQPADVTSLEGLTWPDTYFVSDGQTDEQILQMIVSEFDKHADAVGLGASNAAGLTPHQAVVSASLIQGEAAEPDQANVSGVIVNRLRRGMPLQIDATLCYLKGGCPPVPNNADKQSDSPYNTYRISGLPPTPILTVTESALRAALNPAAHDDLFYVTGTDGVTRFAPNLAGHEANIREHGVRGE
jgi:UPF0755 protein